MKQIAQHKAISDITQTTYELTDTEYNSVFDKGMAALKIPQKKILDLSTKKRDSVLLAGLKTEKLADENSAIIDHFLSCDKAYITVRTTHTI